MENYTISTIIVVYVLGYKFGLSHDPANKDYGWSLDFRRIFVLGKGSVFFYAFKYRKPRGYKRVSVSKFRHYTL